MPYLGTSVISISHIRSGRMFPINTVKMHFAQYGQMSLIYIGFTCFEVDFFFPVTD